MKIEKEGKVKREGEEPFDLVGIVVYSGVILFLVGTASLVREGVIWPVVTFWGFLLLMLGHFAALWNLRANLIDWTKGIGFLLGMSGSIGLFLTGQNSWGLFLAGMTVLMIGHFAMQARVEHKERKKKANQKP